MSRIVYFDSAKPNNMLNTLLDGSVSAGCGYSTYRDIQEKISIYLYRSDKFNIKSNVINYMENFM
jgi:hypothetical protein